jgi:hypothetical protein
MVLKPHASHALAYGASLIYSRWVKKPVILPEKVYSTIRVIKAGTEC